MLRYAITEGARGAAGPHARRQALLDAAQRWITDGINYVQLRERDLPAGELLALATEILQIFHTVTPAQQARPRLLINARADVAVAARADGVHLTGRSGELTPAQVRALFTARGLPTPLVSVACHGLADVQRATGQRDRAGRVDLLLFSPVFEKRVICAADPAGQLVAAGVGLDALRQACKVAAPTPVLALGGVTTNNVAACLGAGAAGVAAIRLFAAAHGTLTIPNDAAET